MHRAMILFVTMAAAGALVMNAQANGSGAPDAAAFQGCTCHAPNPSTGVTVQLENLPAVYDPGTDYALRLTISGPAGLPPAVASAQGGFLVTVDQGTLSPVDNTAANQGANESRVTHNSNGNDQRAWDLVWSTPTPRQARNATFWFAGNAVNGDGTNQNDAWNMNEIVVPVNGTQQGTGNQTEPPQDADASGVAFIGALGALSTIALLRRRRV